MLSQRWFANLPWGMIALVFGITLIGLAAVYSATYTSRGPSPLYYKQLVWVALGVIVMLAALILDYHTIGRFAYIVYAFSLFLLLLVMVIGKSGMGAQRWLAIGPFVFQPSELAKLSLTLALARYFAEDPQPGRLRAQGPCSFPGIMVLVPLVLVLKQPDLGTAIMLLLTSSIIVVLAGIHFRSVMTV